MSQRLNKKIEPFPKPDEGLLVVFRSVHEPEVAAAVLFGLLGLRSVSDLVARSR